MFPRKNAVDERAQLIAALCSQPNNPRGLLDASVLTALLNQKRQQEQRASISALLGSVRQQTELERILHGASILNSVEKKNLASDPLILANVVAAQRQYELANVRQEQMVNNAYTRGREEALLSLIRAGALESVLSSAATTSALPNISLPALQNRVPTVASLPQIRRERPPPNVLELLHQSQQTQQAASILALLEQTQAKATSLSQHPAAPSQAPIAAAPAKQPAESTKLAVASKNDDHLLKSLGAASIERRETNAPYFDASALSDPHPYTLKNRKARGGVTETFPEKLHRMLRDAEESGDSRVVSFFPHGRAFAVHNPTRFVSEVMPRYFRQSRLSSFQRQLNLYGFTRITSGSDVGGYYHELFLKGRPALSVHMKRVGVPSGSAKEERAKGTPINHPNFYEMKPVARR